MINYLIYSKDRASQLDLLLRSIDKYATNINTIILYKTSNNDFQLGYNKLIAQCDKYHSAPTIIPESDFRRDTIELVKNHPCELFGLLTDDSIFYRDLRYTSNELFQLMLVNNCHSFSFRNGLNTKLQCHYQPIYSELECSHINNDIIMWDTSRYSYGTDFGRPVSIDGNIFNYNNLLKTLTEFEWQCPRTLDGVNTKYLGPKMMAFNHSIVVNLPWNLTVGGNADNWGKYYSYSLVELNDRWLKGQKIDLDSIDCSNIISSHQERKLCFV